MFQTSDKKQQHPAKTNGLTEKINSQITLLNEFMNVVDKMYK